MTTPAQAEAEGTDTIDVDWDGVTVTVPASVEAMDLDVLEAFETGKAVSALRAMIGTKGYDELRKRYEKEHGRTAKVGDLGRLMDAIAAAYGFDNQGN